MWGSSIIGFGRHRYKLESGRDVVSALMAFSPRRRMLVLYVLNKFERQEELLSKLEKHNTGKICLYINKLSDVDLEVLEKMLIASFLKVKTRAEQRGDQIKWN